MGSVCPYCKGPGGNTYFTYVNGKEIDGFCSDTCLKAFEAKHGDRDAKGRLRSGTFFGSIGKGIEDNVRRMGGGLFVDIFKLLFKPVCRLVFFILKSIFILLFMGGKMAYRGIKAHIEARRTARASPVEEEKK